MFMVQMRRLRPSCVHGANEALAAWERSVSNIPGQFVTDNLLISQARGFGAQMLDLPADCRNSKINWLA